MALSQNDIYSYNMNPLSFTNRPVSNKSNEGPHSDTDPQQLYPFSTRPKTHLTFIHPSELQRSAVPEFYNYFKPFGCHYK